MSWHGGPPPPGHFPPHHGGPPPHHGGPPPPPPHHGGSPPPPPHHGGPPPPGHWAPGPSPPWGPTLDPSFGVPIGDPGFISPEVPLHPAGPSPIPPWGCPPCQHGWNHPGCGSCSGWRWS